MPQTIIQITFGVIAVLILGSALLVVSTRDIIHSALWLISSFFGVGALYLLLEAEFIAVVQVLVYVGAISILVLFASMLTRHLGEEKERQLYKHWWLGFGSAAGILSVMGTTIIGHDWNVEPAASPATNGEEAAPAVANAVDLGTAFMQEYLLPFEVASIVLLVALIGAVVIAFEERATRRRVLTLAEEVTLRKKQQQQQPETSQEEASGAAMKSDG